VSSYATTKPPNLEAEISSLLLRFQKTSEQVNKDLEIIYSDPTSHWNNSYSGSFTTPFGTYSASGSVSDLATIDFPAQTDPQFMDMIGTAQYALDQSVWAQLLQNFVITQYQPGTEYPCKYYPIKHKILHSKILCFMGVVLKTELGHFSALFCFKT
jgi:hypothetical protein